MLASGSKFIVTEEWRGRPEVGKRGETTDYNSSIQYEESSVERKSKQIRNPPEQKQRLLAAGNVRATA